MLNMNAGDVWIGQANTVNLTNNSFTIDVNGVVTNVAGRGFIVGWTQSGLSISNSLIIKNGGQLWAAALSAGYLYNGTSNCIGNSVWIYNGGVANLSGVVGVGGLTAGGPGNGYMNAIVVTNAGLLNSVGGNIGYVGGGCGYNVSNSATITGSGSIWNLGGGTLSMASTGNALTVANGGMVTNGSGINLSSTAISSIIVTNGGKILGGALRVTGTGNTAWLGGGNQTSTWVSSGDFLFPQGIAISSGNTLTIDANGVMYATNGTLSGVDIGFEQGSYVYNNSLTVQNGGQLWINPLGLTLGYNYSGTAGSSNHTVLITSGGYVNSAAGVTVGGSAYSYNNTLLVSSGGVLEANTMIVGTNAGNSLTNFHGAFQFTSSSPTLTPGSYGRIGINSGTVAFRAITNADVLCNQSGKTLDSASRLAWLGNNTFCLNNATNLATGQAYTFSSAYGATNFAALELMNGGTYRGGAVTIGSGGTLLVTNGMSTIATNLAMLSGATLALDLGAGTNSSLTVQGTANFSGATLVVGLSAAPPTGHPYPILSATGGILANFSAHALTATYGGTNYTLVIRNTGTGITLTKPAGGTGVFFH